MRPSIGVIDYGMGNRRSVQKALEHVGARATITSDRAALERCDGLVLPGVGAFPAAMRNLAQRGLPEFIRERALAGAPLLGICLGMQLLFERSEENEMTAGLGLLPGHVRWLAAGDLRLPHIGWNEVRLHRPSPLTAALPPAGCPFYHVHSLVAVPTDPGHIVGTVEYGERFASMVARDTVLGVQFHPEKSSTHGLLMLGSFLELCMHDVPAATSAARA
jgi:imidazole glycerol-phosphate synthase subunit HisH